MQLFEKHILARRIEMSGRFPAAGDKAGHIEFNVTFEITTDVGDFTLVIPTKVPEGVDGVLEQAREKLAALLSKLAEEAKAGDLGLSPLRVY